MNVITNNVLVYGGELFPTGLKGAAGSKRIVNIAKIINGSGHKVRILAISSSNRMSGQIGDEIKYTCIQKKKGYISKINPFHTGSDYVDALKMIDTNEKIDRIFLVSVFSNAIVPIMSFANRYGIELDLIANDRYEKSSQSFLQNLNTEFAWRVLYKKCKKVIATSRYFEDYFESTGADVLRIPCVFDTTEFCYMQQNSESKNIILAFAGDLRNRKEYIDNAIRALDLVGDRVRDSVVFALAGFDRRDLIDNLGSDKCLLEKHEKNITMYPFLKGQEYTDFLQQSHYTILIRPNLRYARAGFATKFGESMINGIPVLANCVGDIHIYLKDGINGFVVEDETPQAIAKTLCRIVDVDPNRYEIMRSDTYELAEKMFSINSYYEAMAEFLKQP